MKNLILSVILATSFAYIKPAQALLLEPIISYENGFVNYETTTPGVLIGDNHSGFLVGGRVGTDIMGLFYGALDFRTGSINLKASGAGTRTSMGIVFGVDLPLVRAWAGYNFQEDIKANFAGGTDRTISGSAVKVGAGFGLLPLVEISAEYIMMTSGQENDNYYALSASIPL